MCSADQVAVVFFDNDRQSPEPDGEQCYIDELAFATDAVKDALYKFINETKSTINIADWDGAFLKAFKYFENSQDRGKRFDVYGT